MSFVMGFTLFSEHKTDGHREKGFNGERESEIGGLMVRQRD